MEKISSENLNPMTEANLYGTIPHYQNTKPEILAMGSFFKEQTLHIPVSHNENLLGWIGLKGIQEDLIQEEHRHFVDLLARFLAIFLESLGFTHHLESKVTERTQKLKETMDELEQQNTQLLVSTRKMEDLNDLFQIGLPLDDPTELQRIADGFSQYSYGQMTKCVSEIGVLAISPKRGRKSKISMNIPLIKKYSDMNVLSA